MSPLGLALGAVGVSGLGIGAIFAPGLLANVARSVVGVLQQIPPKGWIAIGIVAALIAGFFIHQHRVRTVLAAEYARGSADEDAKWKKRLDQEHAEAMAWKGRAAAAAAAISREEKAKNDAERNAIAARADDQRLHGPGQATAPACSRYSGTPGLPAPASGRVEPDRPVDAGLANVPSEEPMAIVPWNDLTRFGASHDAYRSEVKAWRSWYEREAKAWAEAKAAGSP